MQAKAMNLIQFFATPAHALAFGLIHAEGDTKSKILGINRSLYKDKIAARHWVQWVFSEFRANCETVGSPLLDATTLEQATKNAEAIYQSMIGETARLPMPADAVAIQIRPGGATVKAKTSELPKSRIVERRKVLSGPKQGSVWVKKLEPEGKQYVVTAWDPTAETVSFGDGSNIDLANFHTSFEPVEEAA